MSVNTQRKDYEELLGDVTTNRDAVAGERKIKSKKMLYLPPLPSMTCGINYDDNGNVHIITGSHLTEEGRASYKKYLSLAYFYGATGRTVDGLTGLIFSKNPIKELQPAISYLDKNVDGQGSSLRRQAQKAAREAFITPRSGLLVDFPDVPGSVSIAQAEQSNLRPKIVHYPFESIFNWHYSTVNNETKLTLLVLMETVEVLKDDFTVEEVVKYRVLRIQEGVYTQQLYNDDGNPESEPVVVMVNGQPANEIPFYEIATGIEGKSIINDLVDANLNHYRFFADYAAKEHASAFPVFTETGVSGDDQNVIIGPGAKWTNISPEAQFGILQTASDGGSMRTYLQDMEERMAALGAEMLKPRISGAESAEAKSLDQVAQNSTTADLAITVSEAYMKAINFAARWMNAPEENIFELNTDYNPQHMNPQMFTALMAALQNGNISYQTFYENLQRGEIANPERTQEDEQALIQSSELGLE